MVLRFLRHRLPASRLPKEHSGAGCGRSAGAERRWLVNCGVNEPTVEAFHRNVSTRASSSDEGSVNRFPRLLVGLGVSLLGLLGGAIAAPALAAERVYITFDVLSRSISVAALEEYAITGKSNDEDLAVYAQYAKPKELETLRLALRSRADLSPTTVAQFLYSPQGETALKRLGEVIQPASQQSGDKAIRAALILAASDPEGLTPLNVLKKFPTQGIRIDVARSLGIFNELQRLINQSRRAAQVINTLAESEATTEPLPESDTRDLRRRGPYEPRKQTINLNDPNRTATTATPQPVPTRLALGRVYPVDLYLPNQLPSGSQVGSPTRPQRLVPVVVISHGLGSDRSSFAYLAEQLASHGFAVLVPEHPGSSSRQIQALVQGTAEEVAEPDEFANRPLDVSYLLTYLEQQSASNPDYRSLNLKQVGVIGQSFGGYTALALAGAPINFSELSTTCQSLDQSFNVSLALQCRALQLAAQGQTRSDFRDPRVAAILAMNPIASAVLGQQSLSQIQVPTMIVTGSADTVAPALFEQIRPFIWLTTPEKYLVQMELGTHFSVIGGGPTDSNSPTIPFPQEVIGPNPAIAHRYMDALAVAFFQVTLANQPNYRTYLSAAYAQSISERSLQLSLVRNLRADQLTQNLQQRPMVSDQSAVSGQRSAVSDRASGP
jgi:predicted dienelactone hydrolase